ncbi:hypothetical protein [Agromyces lapidis]|uniref:Multidrug transporter n=1 Tax=Agromyces lapidis TaxID=279574 RepID=A0ABV5SSC7_9MICO|nr:hypothetical protein [Agromyces lapidis]
MSDATRGGSAAGGSERPDAVRLDREGEPVDGGPERGEDANDVEADNAVEEDTIETVDPDNAPA